MTEPREARPAPVSRRRPPALSLATVAAIVTVVVLVSLPSLRNLALRQNESDAARLVRALDAALERAGAALTSEVRAAEVVELEPDLRRRFRDLEVLDDGSVRCHGYLFSVVRPEDGEPAVLAWPWAFARTGFAVWALEDGQLWCARNDDGRWSGPGSAPPPPSRASGWSPAR